MTDERLITQAAAAIEMAWIERVKEDRPDTLAERAARAVFSVFKAHANELATSPEHVKNQADSLHVEAAHAPTDDEREALATVIERAWGDPTWDGKTLRPLDRQIADAVLAWMREQGFRRSEVPEPSADEAAKRATELASSTGYGTPLGFLLSELGALHDKWHGDEERTAWVNAPLAVVEDAARRVSATPEPQGEPSAAQVGAAMHAVERYYASQGITSEADSVDYQAMRAALRAAEGVR